MRPTLCLNLLFLRAALDCDLEESPGGAPLACSQSALAQATLLSRLCQLLSSLSAFLRFRALNPSYHDGLETDFLAPRTRLCLAPKAADAGADAKAIELERGLRLGDDDDLELQLQLGALGAQGASCRTRGLEPLQA